VIRSQTLPRPSEAEWQASVLEAAHRFGWATFHVYDSRRSNPGFPDLVCVREHDAGVRLVFAELKVRNGRLREEQKTWMDLLGRVGGNVQAEVWRWPQSWDRVLEVLAPEGWVWVNGKLWSPAALADRRLG